ncbi:MAG: ABC transporter substrate-binding protein [Aquabacterium sp.]
MTTWSRRAMLALGAGALATVATPAALGQAVPVPADWPRTLQQARGQTVYFNAWAGDEKTNAFIAWVGGEMQARFGVRVVHVRLKDTAEAVARVVSERSAGRDRDGSVDLLWVNGPNLLALRQQALLAGPVTTVLPNWPLVDTRRKLSNIIDFTVPVDGFAVPWRLAQLVFIIDTARHRGAPPSSAPQLLDWARRHPGRLTHPSAQNFIGASFLKQALLDLTDDASRLQLPVRDDDFERVTRPLWDWYDALRPHLWRGGRQFPENGPAQRQLLNDGEIDITLSFTPSEAAVAVRSGLLPASVRTFTFAKGTLGNTSFVAIPYNARAREGALVLANFLIDPMVQARAQDLAHLGAVNVLNAERLSPAQRALFEGAAEDPALPSAQQLSRPQLEPHASWMTRITSEWQRRVSR